MATSTIEAPITLHVHHHRFNSYIECTSKDLTSLTSKTASQLLVCDSHRDNGRPIKYTVSPCKRELFSVCQWQLEECQKVSNESNSKLETLGRYCMKPVKAVVNPLMRLSTVEDVGSVEGVLNGANNCPLVTAVLTDNSSQISTLLEKKAGINLNAWVRILPTYEQRSTFRAMMNKAVERRITPSDWGPWGKDTVEDVDVYYWGPQTKECEESKLYQGLTPLHVAITAQKNSACKTLMEAGANLDFKSKSGEPPMATAIRVSNDFAVKELLSREPDLDFRDKNGDGLLALAVNAKDFKIFKRIFTSIKSRSHYAVEQCYLAADMAIKEGKAKHLEYLLKNSELKIITGKNNLLQKSIRPIFFDTEYNEQTVQLLTVLCEYAESHYPNGIIGLYEEVGQKTFSRLTSFLAEVDVSEAKVLLQKLQVAVTV